MKKLKTSKTNQKHLKNVPKRLTLRKIVKNTAKKKKHSVDNRTVKEKNEEEALRKQ